MANGKRINKHKLAVTQAYCIIGLFVLFGAVVGFIIGRVSTPAKVETVTVTETVEVPVYEQGQLPAVKDVAYFDVPLSHSLQRYIYEVCADEGVPVTLIIAMIDHESRFNPEAVSTTNDYGLMQINAINHEWLEERYRTADMLDPYQNVFCGVKLISRYITKYEDYGKALMAYNMGDYGARKACADCYRPYPGTVDVGKAKSDRSEPRVCEGYHLRHDSDHVQARFDTVPELLGLHYH